MALPEREARDALVGLSRIVRAELATVMTEFRKAGLSPAQVRDALLTLLPELGEEYRLAAATLAADWYDDARDAAMVAGAFRAEPVGPVGRARWEALARWGVDPLFSGAPDWQAAGALLAGGLQRSVADGHRLTVVDNSMRDPKAQGWRRVGVGGSCGFCSMLIGRDHVYTDSSVTFKSHDNCNCAASPEWSPNVTKVIGVPFEASKRWRTEEQKAANRKRVRKYLADAT